MAIFNSYVTNYQRVKPPFFHATMVFSGPCPSDPRAKWQTAETRRVAGAFYILLFQPVPAKATVENVGNSMEIHGISPEIWLFYGNYMEIYGNIWKYMAIFDVSIGGKSKGNHIPLKI